MPRRGLLLSLLLAAVAARGDEGMWTFDQLPLDRIRAAYGAAPDAAWLEHLRLALLDVGNGSGAFVSRDGLVATNHHVLRQAIAGLAGPGRPDYLAAGFVARTRAEEVRLPGLVLHALVQTVEVTAQVEAAVATGAGAGAGMGMGMGMGMDERQAGLARERAHWRLAEDLAARTRLRVLPVTLYRGGEYWLYAYRPYRDVRLVAAPEAQIAFFGGDPDNFTFPRHDLDFALLRVYEGGQPCRPAHWLRWSRSGAAPGQLTFVAGRPGRTRRLDTVAELRFLRDVVQPDDLATLAWRRDALRDYARRPGADLRRLGPALFDLDNTLKALQGSRPGLDDPAPLAALEAREAALRAAVAGDPALAAGAGASWDRIAAALADLAPLVRVRDRFNRAGSNLLAMALDLVRVVGEADRPAAERLEGYRDRDDLAYRRGQVERGLPAEDRDLETWLLIRSLDDLRARLAPDHPLLPRILDGREAGAWARSAVLGTRMDQRCFREDLVQGGPRALARSRDPLVKLALALEAEVRPLEARREDRQAVVQEHARRIGRARLAVEGHRSAPDATATPRFSYGPVLGYRAKAGPVAPVTTFGDLYDRAAAKGPVAEGGAWALPERWREGQGRLDPRTPLNFCHQVDITGGSSGSPVVDARGELVGILFDSTRESLPGTFHYDGTVNRAVSVDVRAVAEALERLYGAGHLVEELYRD